MHVETVALGHDELDGRGHTAIRLGADSLHAVAVLEGDANGQQP
jgi:hypothetical protein